jgi:hypothetical protein
MSQPQRATRAVASQQGFFGEKEYRTVSEQGGVTNQITHIPSRLKPGNRTTNRYSTGVVSTAIQLSGGGGASFKKGS